MQIPDENYKQKFQSTTSGLVRSRIGRGGRIIYDRGSMNLKQPTEYEAYKLLDQIKLDRVDRNHEKLQILRKDNSSSNFKLQDVCSGSFENYENEFDME